MKNAVLIITLLFTAGCVTSEVKTVVVPALTDYTPTLAWCMHSKTTPTPVNTPDTVKVGDKCPTCGGDGELGDGRTIIACRDCGGDGTVHKGDLILGTGSAPPQASVMKKYTYFINYNNTEYIWDGNAFSAPGKEPIKFSNPYREVERMGQVQICQQNRPCQIVKVQRR